MKKKDYLIIAQRIKSTKNTYSGTVARAIVDDLSLALTEIFREDNARFNHIKFLEACGFTFKESMDFTNIGR